MFKHPVSCTIPIKEGSLKIAGSRILRYLKFTLKQKRLSEMISSHRLKKDPKRQK